MKNYLPYDPCRRFGFTLVELLITITIMVILASVALFTMFGVQQMAKTQRCKAQIKKIHEIIAEKWESYGERRYPPPPSASAPNMGRPYWWNGWYQQLKTLDPTLAYRMDEETAWREFDRLWKIRETMRMDLPDRSSDIRLIRRRPNKEWNSDSKIPPTADSKYFYRMTNGRDLGMHASAECLYMILSRARVDDQCALEFFSEKEIGDKDGDGFPEVWDPWGNPIVFVRWPTGFWTFQPAPGVFSSPIQNVPAGMMINRGLHAPDAFDLFNVDTGGFFHFSLIASAGPDGEYGFAVEKETNMSTADAISESIDFSDVANQEQFPPGFPPDYPTTIFGSRSDPWRLGSPFTKASMDNIHNHLIEVKSN